MKPGDTFTLTMPCVYKFTDRQTSIPISANGITYAWCDHFNGENIVAYSELECTVSDSVKSDTFATGMLLVPFTFNVGGGGGPVDLTCAKTFNTSGTNRITWTHGDKSLSSTARFNNGSPLYVDSTNPSQWNYDARSLVDSPQLQQINLGAPVQMDYSKVPLELKFLVLVLIVLLPCLVHLKILILGILQRMLPLSDHQAVQLVLQQDTLCHIEILLQ